jgi:hypothetical protein
MVDPQFMQRYQAPLRTMIAPQSEQLGASSDCSTPARLGCMEPSGYTVARSPVARANCVASPVAFSILAPVSGEPL